ncbi:CD44 antigen isoform X8 [Erinaceus europaeus]|uniref:CD44 antigen n=1 Tax=Erinaceus europaeus TaxID=9365 RepID=A0ABM3W7M3_ERIEU|nr:CD44 antigen isoform X8 [Erinaceus europaeus]
MDKFWWRAAWGLFLVQLSLCQSQIDLNVTCRYAGVFHVEKNGRYSISRTEAPDLCRAFNSTLPTMDQMQKALETGFETCRYGFIDGHVVIPRIHPNSICAANKTGVYILPSNTSQYDTYCFNASAPLEEDCTSVTDLPNSFEGQVTINIVNRDGTRYTKKGEYRTNPNDINPSSAPEEDMSSGSPSERSTSVGYSIFHTLLPTAYPTSEQDYSEKSPTTITTASAHESHPNQRMTTQSQDDSFWTDFFDPISHPMGRGHQTEGSMDVDSSHSTMLQPSTDPNTGLVEDLDRTEPLSTTTQQTHTQSFSTSYTGLEENEDQQMNSTPTPSNRNDGRSGRKGGNHPEDSTTSVEGYTSHSPDTVENRTLTSETPDKTGSPAVTEVIVGNDDINVDRSQAEDHYTVDDSDHYHPTDRSGPDGHSSGSQEGGANTTSRPIRKSQIPEWLIILASLLALALILAVCIAVNSRRRCGQKKKLVINSGNGAVEDRKPSGLNGEASKSQEMVHLVNKEPSETPDQFMTTDETQNLQNVDVKIGV